MGSIPLPALQIHQQPSAVEQFGQVMQLKQLMASGEMQKIQLQQAQQQQDDQTKLRELFKQTGGDLDKTIQAAPGAGVSPNTIIALQNHSLQVKTQLATLTKDRLANAAQQNDAANGLTESVLNAKDKPAAYAQARQQMLTNPEQYGITDPSHVPPEQYPGDDALQQQLAVHQGAKIQFDQEMKRREVAAQETKAQTPESQTFNSLIKQGMSPPDAFKQMKQLQQVGPAQQEMSDWLAKHPGKGPSDYEIAMKKIVPAYNFSLQNTGAGGQGGQPSPIAQAIANGSMKWNDAVSMRTPMSVKAQMLAEVKQLNPNFNSGDFSVEQAVKKSFTSGPEARTLNAFNTATEHLNLLGNLADGLKNGNMQIVNSIANKFATATGSAAPTSFEMAKNAVAGEVSKTFKGGGATDEEIKAINSTISQAQSPAQLKGAIATATALMNSKREALQSQYQQGVKGQPNFGNQTQPAGGGKEIHYKIVNGQLVPQ